jgi:ubiquinone/menaquinone biosynthesis C-methylase UbiE
MFKSNRTVSKTDISNLDLATRVSMEAQITDARVEELDFEQLKRRTTSLAEYAAPVPWRQYLFDFLGPFEGKVMLDIACGYSMTPVMFALAGATVFAVDVAPKSVAMVQWVAEAKGVADRVKVHVGPAETLPFDDESFDLIYGGAALHHLQLDRAGPEIARVLKKGGKGGFQDPLGHNLLLEFVRDHVPYKGKHPVKGTDLPILLRDVETFGRNFSAYLYRGFELFSMAAKPFKLDTSSRLRRMLDTVDEFVFKTAPYTQRYARFVVTCVTK